MIERFRYRSARKAAEYAIRVIAPQVPTINTWGKDYYKVAPYSCKGFWKIAWDSGMKLQHQTSPRKTPYVLTEVNVTDQGIEITEHVKNGDNTQLRFFEGKFEGACTWNQVNTTLAVVVLILSLPKEKNLLLASLKRERSGRMQD
ncbi:MAG: hypothetical protein A2857_04170 [Candidatus Levybacteria bacterium RIFCSPHIGHO2_01_FULL_36_15]|nr:MAG: hypothetical protein A2857_04170 [Candidatus Levybacteria bacterium RIFCSPHIGHO2_01_FULL_36_15]